MITFKELEELLDEAHKIGDKVLIHKGPADVKGKHGHVSEIRKGLYKGAPKTYTVDYDHHETTGNRKSIQLKPTHFKAVKEDLDEARMTAAMKLQQAFQREQEKTARERKAGEDLLKKNEPKKTNEETVEEARVANSASTRAELSKRPAKPLTGKDAEKKKKDSDAAWERLMAHAAAEKAKKTNEEVVLEAGNKPLEPHVGMGDSRTPRELKTQMTGASNDFVKSTAAKKPGVFHSKVAHMQNKLAKSELRKRTNEEVEQIDEAPKDHTIEAHGIKGMKRTPWRKTFKHEDHLHDWAEKNDADVHGTRELEGAKKSVKEDTLAEGAYEKAEENKRSAEAAKSQARPFDYHMHMADHHDNMAQWHESKGRHGEAAKHAEKSDEHHEKAMSVKEEVACNNVGGGAIAGTQGDAGKKSVAIKMMKRKELKNFKEFTESCDCWTGYKRVPGTKPCEKGSCKKA